LLDVGVLGSTFGCFVGIDYSGAETPTSSLKGLRVYWAECVSLPVEVQPPQSPRTYWTRRGIAAWLVELLKGERPALVGIDHGFSFPVQYFDKYHLPHDWPAFLDDFQRHWPTDEDRTTVEVLRQPNESEQGGRLGEASWRRLTEERAGAAKSVFQFDVQGSVAKSTHAGLPWLRYLRNQLGDRVHFWPLEGWEVPAERSVIAEVYPSLWRHEFAREDRTSDQHDAFAVATWLQRAGHSGALGDCLNPALTQEERVRASIEGWILGVGGTWQSPSRS
jgi:hypothetical protein